MPQKIQHSEIENVAAEIIRLARRENRFTDAG